MGFLSSSVSVNRYCVEGKIEEPVLDFVRKGLRMFLFKEAEGVPLNKTIGWTSFNNHFCPDFENSSFVLGKYFVFSLRIDKKNVSPKIIKKNIFLETTKILRESGRLYLSADEKKNIKENVLASLLMRVPAVPNIYDIVWNYEKSILFFFSNNKSANEDFESVFHKSFRKKLIRIFPYSEADILSGLSDYEHDSLVRLSPTKFM
jgi:DNA recombination-dependent growth factor C